MIARVRAHEARGSSPRDERDAGARQVLNLGHTVGHAIETVTGYARYRHGEAVGARPAGGAAAVRAATSCAREVAELLRGARAADRRSTTSTPTRS